MELKIAKEDEKRLVVELQGETVSFSHMLKDELCKDSNVKEAAAIQEHPYMAQPKIFVAVYRGTPRTALEKASENIGKQGKEFKDKFKSASK